MNNDKLNTIIEPKAIGFTFEAPGWTVLLAIAIFMSMVVLAIQLVKYRENKYRRLATKQLEEIKKNSSLTLANKARLTSTLLKQVCLYKYQRQQVATLNGIEWYSFLNLQTKRPHFDLITFEHIDKGLFDNSILEDKMINNFIDQTKIWITKHVV